MTDGVCTIDFSHTFNCIVIDKAIIISSLICIDVVKSTCKFSNLIFTGS